MRARILLALVCCIAALALAEWWLRAHLFDQVSYSNSESIDRQLKSRDTEGPWGIIFVGDSEVRWGIDPRSVDTAFEPSGKVLPSFNHAFDGFGASWWPSLLPALLAHPSLGEVHTVAVGVQLTDLLRVIKPGEDGCGSLQRPVLSSPFAVDLGVENLCRTRTWDAQLGRQIFGELWTVRYAPSVRTLLLPSGMFASNKLALNSRSQGLSERGFQPHRTLGEDRESYAQEFERWKAQYKPDRDFVPLPVGAWNSLTAPGGFFDELHGTVKATNRRLVLFALPTNPVVIDTFNRRADYAANSALLAQWANDRGVVFIDLGINDARDADTFFSDMRHLSGVGARIYSSELGRAMANAGIRRETAK